MLKKKKKEEGAPQNNKINKKGFTLIELLAVIIILGILMLIAIPSVTNYIANSRKKTYVAIAGSYVDAVKVKVNATDYAFNDPNTTYYVHINNVELEKGGKSPFGDWLDAYVAVVIDKKGASYDYYWVSVDKAGYKVLLKDIDSLIANDVIVSNNKTINNKVAIGGRTKVYIIDKDGNIIETQGELELTETEAEQCYYFDIIDNKVIITNYNASCGLDVMIPSKIGGYPVIAIDDYAFQSKGLTSVIIPNGVISIGANAFANNKITEISIPNSVTTIGSRAFANNLLTEISLPSSVTSIGGGAFTLNKFPDESAMIYAQKPDGSPDYSKVIGYGGNSTDLVIPGEKNGVVLKTIGSAAFRSSGLTSVSIPDSVEVIEGSAFYTNKLTSVILPSNLKTIGGSAFRSAGLKSLSIPDSVTSIGSLAFTGNSLPDNQAYIYKRNTNGTIDYSNIIGYGGATKNIVIPQFANGIELKTISTHAFYGNALTGITIPTSVTSIGKMAFNQNKITGTAAYVYKRTTSGIDYSTLISYGGAAADIVIPKTTNGVDLKVIDLSAFEATSMKSVVIPDSVLTIGNTAFYRCNLTAVTIPSSVTSIGTNAFAKSNESTAMKALATIVNKTGKSFNWKSITGSNYDATFVTGTIKHQYGNMKVVSE